LGEIAGVPEWENLSAKARVYATDASAYFSRPGPRLVDGVELLAYVFLADKIPGLSRPAKGQISELVDGNWIDLSADPVGASTS
jgi:hypothetical protein